MTEQTRWIGSGQTNPSDNRLPPELFRRTFHLSELPVKALLTATAMGIYETEINGAKAGDAYFTPGYTHYQTYVQEESYDVTAMLQVGENRVDVTVANGWWLGTIGDKNNWYGDHRGVYAELRMAFADGREQVLGTDDAWRWTDDTPTRYADFYNGEIIDARNADEGTWCWHKAVALEGALPESKPHDGAMVRTVERLQPVGVNGNIYDFGQNHAGLLTVTVRAERGTIIKVRHSEILDEKGGLFTANLRRAKQELILTCGTDGEQTFAPRFTFMGFRYAEVTADRPCEIVRLESRVLSSDCRPLGDFSCSNPLLNRLYKNVLWGQTSNFIDIPTDCPQRDERMGWTGDIAVFAETASINRDIHDFTRKWLRDLRLDQKDNGAIPVTVPEMAVYQPEHRVFPIAIWGDAATMVPWAVYQAYGDLDLLREQYASMRAWTMAELKTAAHGSTGWRQHLWNRNPFQYGDWCAPGESYYKWIAKGKHLSTCFMANSVSIMQKAASALGHVEDAEYFGETLECIRDAYTKAEWLRKGRLRGDFASNYVCALYFDLLPEAHKPIAAARLAELVRANDYKIMTGFAGTPYILFALADNGYVDDAFKLLLNEDCPGWLYTVKAGATTMWERWDALNTDGTIRADTIPDMVSFNHYAYGAVGAFFYRRILGIEAIEPGYRRFSVRPITGGGLTRAEGRIGEIAVAWRVDGGKFLLNVTVPDCSEADIVLPSGKAECVKGGTHYFEDDLK